MRCTLTFELPEAVFPADSARLMIGFLKKTIESYDETLYEKLFGNGQTQMKSYAYSLYLPVERFENGQFILNQPFFRMTFTSCSLEEFGMFFAAFANQKEVPYHSKGEYQFTLKELTILKNEKVLSEQVVAKFMSPLSVLKHDVETGRKTFYTVEDEGFAEALKDTLQYQIKTLAPHLSLDEFEIIPLQVRTVKVSLYNVKTNATRGSFYLSGSKELLQFLYDAGIGNNRGAGCGLFNIIQ